MDTRTRWRYRGVLWATLLLAAIVALWPTMAAAHSKWFAPFDITEAPLPLVRISDWLFVSLNLAAGLLLWAASRFEKVRLGQRVSALLDTAVAPLPDRIEILLRVGTGAFFLTQWALGTAILTPELQTEAAWPAWLQFFIAAGMLYRPMMPLSALGIGVLYGYGIWLYGPFHMLDYPIFLGLAAYLALSASSSERLLELRMHVAKWAVSISLMWGSIEKFAYSHRTFPILEHHPVVTFGIQDTHTFLHIAGTVEFAIAFALLWTPLIRRAAALVLIVLFLLAIPEFGKIDAIGHMIFIVMVIAVFLDNSKWPDLSPGLSPVMLTAMLGFFFVFYYSAHNVFYSATATPVAGLHGGARHDGTAAVVTPQVQPAPPASADEAFAAAVLPASAAPAPAPALAPAPAPVPAPAADRIVARADALLQTGDLAAARLLYEMAAAQGSPGAATMVGKTYDPDFLAEVRARGIRSDPAKALAWYRKASNAGDPEAARRLQRLSARQDHR